MGLDADVAEATIDATAGVRSADAAVGVKQVLAVIVGDDLEVGRELGQTLDDALEVVAGLVRVEVMGWRGVEELAGALGGKPLGAGRRALEADDGEVLGQ